MFGRKKVTAELGRARSLAARLEQQNARLEHIARSEVIPLLESYDCECSDDDGMCGRCYAVGLLEEALVSPAFSDRVSEMFREAVYGRVPAPKPMFVLEGDSLEWMPGSVAGSLS